MESSDRVPDSFLLFRVDEEGLRKMSIAIADWIDGWTDVGARSVEG